MVTYLINRLPSESLALKSLKDLFLGHYLHVHVGPELPLNVFGCVLIFIKVNLEFLNLEYYICWLLKHRKRLQVLSSRIWEDNGDT